LTLMSDLLTNLTSQDIEINIQFTSKYLVSDTDEGSDFREKVLLVFGF